MGQTAWFADGFAWLGLRLMILAGSSAAALPLAALPIAAPGWLAVVWYPALALLWLAAFFFACGIFLGATLLLRGVPPTPHVAVGRVTVEDASKLRDYLAVLLFFVLVPPATIWDK